jgi:predicted ArsR family transcriptional regulator
VDDKPSFSDDLTRRLVDLIADLESEGGGRGPDLASRLRVSTSRVRKELKELEALGIVRRTGVKRGTRWWLG